MLSRRKRLPSYETTAN